MRSTATETVKIESGGQDAYRHDLVCLRYSTDDGGTEGVELVTIKGTAAANAGGASDPVPPNVGGDSSAGAPVDIPIVRVLLDGLAPAAEWLPPAGSVPAYVFGTITEYQAEKFTSPALVYVLAGSTGSLEVYFEDGRD